MSITVNMQESEERDLGELVEEELFHHADCFDSRRYHAWERDVATPAIEAKGYRVLSWWTTDGDSFGPLVRAVKVEKDGEKSVFYYG